MHATVKMKKLLHVKTKPNLRDNSKTLKQAELINLRNLFRCRLDNFQPWKNVAYAGHQNSIFY